MRHCGHGSGCSQHYLNYDAKVCNLSLPSSDCWLLQIVPNWSTTTITLGCVALCATVRWSSFHDVALYLEDEDWLWYWPSRCICGDWIQPVQYRLLSTNTTDLNMLNVAALVQHGRPHYSSSRILTVKLKIIFVLSPYSSWMELAPHSWLKLIPTHFC